MLFVPAFVPGQELARAFYEEVIDQFVDFTDVTSKPGVFPRVASLFEAWGEAET
jgi:hypothetical protein